MTTDLYPYDNETFVKGLTLSQLTFLSENFERDRAKTLGDSVISFYEDFSQKFIKLLDEAKTSKDYHYLSQLGTWDIDVDRKHIAYKANDRRIDYEHYEKITPETLKRTLAPNPIQNKFSQLLRHLIFTYEYRSNFSVKFDGYSYKLSPTEDYQVLVQLVKNTYGYRDLMRTKEYHFGNLTCQKTTTLRSIDDIDVKETITLGTVPITPDLVKDINHLASQLTPSERSQLLKSLLEEED